MDRDVRSRNPRGGQEQRRTSDRSKLPSAQKTIPHRPYTPVKRGQHAGKSSATQSRSSNAPPEIDTILPRPEPEVSEDGTVIVSNEGDVVLAVSERTPELQHHRFRVLSSKLTETSSYFDRLLRDQRFAEAASISSKHTELLLTHGSLSEVAAADLPRVEVDEVGQTSTVKSVLPLMRDLLLILHDKELPSGKLPLQNAANLAVVADRFDCLVKVSQYVTKRSLVSAPNLTSGKALDETVLRQRLLLGVLLKDPRAFDQCSQLLIRLGSKRWLEDDAEADHETEAMWWHLPSGLEEELVARRQYILATIAEVQGRLMAQYTSREMQCKLGYDSSLQCDSFQCGQFIQFLVKKGLIALPATYGGEEREDAIGVYAGDVERLIEELRACPGYQINQHHSHCGPRKALLASLGLVQKALASPRAIGVCLECLTDGKHPGKCLSWADRPWKRLEAVGRREARHSSEAAHGWSSFTSKGEEWGWGHRSLFNAHD